MDKRNEFLQKLHDLLNEYNVSIDAGYEGDTHGIYGENISINHKPSGSFREVEWFREDHTTSLSAQSLKDEF